MGTILYLSYGSGPHVDETVFSLLTAFKFLPPDNGQHRYVVYTDQPDAFAGLGVTIRPIEPAELESWLGGSDYIHRRKTMVILDALRRYPGALAFVDCDTYFRRSPARLFERIGPGRSVLHVLEARLLQSGTEIDRKLSDLVQQESFYDRAGKPVAIGADASMWNSGVIGIHSDDAGLLEDALTLSDQMWRRVKVHHIEQFVTGILLERNELRECRDIVFHYWADYLRNPFRQRLPAILAGLKDKPLPARVQQAYLQRPRPSPSRWAKIRVRGLARRAGFGISGIMKSA